MPVTVLRLPLRLLSPILMAAPTAGLAADFPPSLDKAAITAWVPANTTLSLSQVISVGGGRVVALMARKAEPGPPPLTRITIRTEIVTAAAAAEAGALSEAQDLQVDCAARTAKAGEMQQYSGRNLTGALRTLAGWTEWVRAEPGTTLGRMVEAACGPAPAPAAAPPTPAASAPTPAASAPRPAAGGLSNFVQISASTSLEQAEASIAEFRRAFPEQAEGRPMSVEPTLVGGQTFHRALVGGFADAKAASGFCQGLKAAGRDCILRQR